MHPLTSRLFFHPIITKVRKHHVIQTNLLHSFSSIAKALDFSMNKRPKSLSASGFSSLNRKKMTSTLANKSIFSRFQSTKTSSIKSGMNDLSYFNLVQKTLIETWSKHEQPLQINPNELTTSMKLLTKIAVEAIRKSSLKKPEFIDKQVDSKTESESTKEIADKIQAFVADKAYAFKIACQTGSPISLLENYSKEAAIKKFIEIQFVYSCYSDPEFSKRLLFNDKKGVCSWFSDNWSI